MKIKPFFVMARNKLRIKIQTGYARGLRRKTPNILVSI
jgi:hypothetical protein